MKIAPVKLYQAVQHSLNHIDYLLVTSRPLTQSKKQKLEFLFLDTLHPEMNVFISESNEIPRSKNGKYEEFLSLL